jgi:hypothetical protein
MMSTTRTGLHFFLLSLASTNKGQFLDLGMPVIQSTTLTFFICMVQLDLSMIAYTDA